MDPSRISASELAVALGITPCQLAAVIDKQAPITSDLALRLARFFGISARFWLGLQMAYDLAAAQAASGAEIEARVRPLAA